MLQSLFAVVLGLSSWGGVQAAAIQSASSASPTGTNWTGWGPCPAKRESKVGMHCANLTVPVNWDDPSNGETVVLSMNRIKAKDPNGRVGSLIFNPGGPGDMATATVINFELKLAFIQQALLDQFDIIGLDPRGVGRSSPIKCDRKIWNERVTLYPQTEAEFNKLVNHNKAFAQSCIERSGSLVGYVDSVSVAKDMEAVRVALGDEKLNFIGLSYGTTIGAQYAELFPDNIRAMVLDGITDHSESEVITQYTEYMGYELEFVRFAEWCEAEKGCPLYGRDIKSEFLQLIKKAETTPIPAPKCKYQCRKDVTWWELLMNMQDWLITKKAPKGFVKSTDTWHDLAQILKQAFAGDASQLSSEIAVDDHSRVWQGQMVNCLDYLHASRDVHDLRYQQQLGFTQAPYTRGCQESYTPSAACLGWPYPVRNPPHDYNVSTTAPPILLVNSFYDPETPLSQAVAIQEQIPTGVLLLRNGDGHQSMVLNGSASLMEASYLINLTLPAPNTVVNS